jgi:iduronate 2-sulfatase
MGYSMVTSRYHYVEWYHWDDPTKTAGDLAAVELYDLQSDPDETTNIAGHPENADTIRDLADKLKAGWQGALN